jgi:hypothetical protein
MGNSLTLANPSLFDILTPILDDPPIDCDLRRAKEVPEDEARKTGADDDGVEDCGATDEAANCAAAIAMIGPSSGVDDRSQHQCRYLQESSAMAPKDRRSRSEEEKEGKVSNRVLCEREQAPSFEDEERLRKIDMNSDPLSRSA